MQFTIEHINKSDDYSICKIIKQVGAEYGAIGEGFGPSDPEVLCISEHYIDSLKSLYLVAKVGSKIVGGGGLAPFNDSAEICELKKLFLLPEARRMGIGREISVRCLEYAKAHGFCCCYIDTLSTMKPAIALYKQLGFTHLDTPLQGTEHNGCDTWMLRQLIENYAVQY